MRNIIMFLGVIIITSLIIAGCGQTNTKQKELDLKERELALKEKELALKDNIKTTDITSVNQALPVPKVPIVRASDITPKCDPSSAPAGDHPLINLYCGALGKKAIEIYITGVDVSSKKVMGYSIVGTSRTSFEGTFSSREHKAASNQAENVVDVASTIYKLILREPDQVNKNGVFNLELELSTIATTGYGTWTSYDGMLYREIKLIDRFNDL
jgi:outer membrane murein-binding lipoprotein Lpp